MEELVEKYGWKKVVVVIIVITLLGLFYVMTSLMNIDKAQIDKMSKEKATLPTEK